MCNLYSITARPPIPIDLAEWLRFDTHTLKGAGMRRAGAILSLLLLGGCITDNPQNLAQQDDATCKSYGAVPGSDAYVNCRMQRDNTRQQGEALRRAAIIASPN
jgi:hypothetical protein